MNHPYSTYRDVSRPGEFSLYKLLKSDDIFKNIIYIFIIGKTMICICTLEDELTFCYAEGQAQEFQEQYELYYIW